MVTRIVFLLSPLVLINDHKYFVDNNKKHFYSNITLHSYLRQRVRAENSQNITRRQLLHPLNATLHMNVYLQLSICSDNVVLWIIPIQPFNFSLSHSNYSRFQIHFSGKLWALTARQDTYALRRSDIREIERAINRMCRWLSNVCANKRALGKIGTRPINERSDGATCVRYWAIDGKSVTHHHN